MLPKEAPEVPLFFLQFLLKAVFLIKSEDSP